MSTPRLPTPRLRDLLALTRRALARADALALAAPLCVVAATGCSPTPPSTDVTDVEIQTGATVGGGELVEVHSSSVAAGGGEEPVSGCRVEPVNVTGCGGGRAKLLSSRADCELEKDGDIDVARCKVLCGSFEASGCSVGDRDGESFVFCHAAHPCLGRMPMRGLRATRRASADVASYLAHAARMEAVSVDAFEELEASLAELGAPKSLGAGCMRAAADEARHAETMTCLLRARGGRVRGGQRRTASAKRGEASAPGKGATPKRFASLEALAIHNEREGVVGETWGAMLAAFQAARAADPEVRRALATIAREELQHAALSARIGAWSRRKLDAAGRARVDRERARTLARIAQTSTGFAGRERDNELGWPSEAERAVLVEELAAFFA